MKPVCTNKNSLVISIDPRIELLSIVQHLSQYRQTFPYLLTYFDHPYRKDVDEWFSQFKSHVAVKIFDRLASQSFNFDAPVATLLYMDDRFSLDEAIFRCDHELNRAGGKEQLLAFIDSLRAFAEESGFAEFYENHHPFYTQIVCNTVKMLKGRDIISELECYYGDNKNSYTVITVPLYGTVGFAHYVELMDGSNHIYSVIGPTNHSDGIPVFDSIELQWHEFSHSFVGPVISKHWNLCEQYAHLFPPMEEQMNAQAYGSWRSTVEENIVRAVTTRLACHHDGPDAEVSALQREMERGFVFTDIFVNKLKEYEQNREKYPTLDSFLPELIRSLDDFQGHPS